MTQNSFPDVSFIQQGRQIEAEAVAGVRRLGALSTYPFGPEGEGAANEDEQSVALTTVDEVEMMEERVSILDMYVSYVEGAFQERGLPYPFRRTSSGDSLAVRSRHRSLAEQCAELGTMVGIGDRPAKQFELRAAKALHCFIGCWAVCVGAPRRKGTGAERAVKEFRGLIPEEKGTHVADHYPRSGDFGADGFWILGRSWGGPLIYFQAKNSSFSIRDVPGEFLRVSDTICEWFGRRLDHFRAVILVYAVNTIFTRELKERAFRSSGPTRGYHIIDALDILHAENSPQEIVDTRDELIIM